MQTARREELADDGKAPPDRPALKPYWGKPAVRNFRGDDGNVGIIRSPVRAIVLPGERIDQRDRLVGVNSDFQLMGGGERHRGLSPRR